ncbi:hypothetical protein [Variovorax ginsengisoli]|uniref:O-antigen ligase domain-containing protein n=1 Tax=Variovorax ginsengisoli TaxID=363844 RepID=A0ABT9SEI7_9BURK|nr:hypothetical protein [Variovorax ginsengisoli]MDP9902193.1 hypothetical protein [Variovorax ginsengisoli]
MAITVLGVFFFLAGILAFAARPKYLLPILVFAAIFQGAAVFNLSGGIAYGLSPYYFIASLVFVKQLTFIEPVVLAYWPNLRFWLCFFVVVVVVMAMTMPFLFSGLPVYNPRAGVDEQYGSLTDLAFGFGNLSHIVYLILNASVLRAFFLASNFGPRELIGKAFDFSAGVVVIVGLYQWMHMMFGVPFPFDLIYSNAQIREAMPDDMQGYSRIFSTFPESSYCAAYLTAYLFYFIFAKNKDFVLSFFGVACVGVVLLCIALTGSTTGYLALMATALFALIVESYGKTKAFLYGVVTLLVFVLSIFAFALTPFGQELIIKTLLEKGDTLSTLHRLAADQRAIEIFFETFGLGVGLGSNRASSFISTTLSNFGLIGFLLMMFCVFLHLSWLWVNYNFSRKIQLPRMSAMWAFVSLLAAMILAIPDINWPIFWVVWGVSVVMSVQRTDYMPGVRVGL